MTVQGNCKKTVKLIIIFGLLSTGLPSTSAVLDDLITGICIEEFKTEMKNASLSIPRGMDQYTCKCFISLLNKGSSLDSAKTICREKASKKYNL